MIQGNLEGIKDSILDQIELLYDFEIDKDTFITKNLAERLCYFTQMLNREVSVYINRKGKIVDISIGNHSTVNLPQYDDRRSESRLCGIRCIHTHPSGEGNLSNIDINALLNLRFDAMASIGVIDGNITEMYCAVNTVEKQKLSGKYVIMGPYNISNIEAHEIIEVIKNIDKQTCTIDNIETQEIEERAILIGVQLPNSQHDINRTCEESLQELELLAESAGAVTIQKILQNKPKFDSAYYVGRGKAEEISLIRQSENANLIIFDDELSGAQIRNLEDVIGAKVIDRTTLILDIFAKHAKSKEGKIQVELAQLKYRLSRLLGLGFQLSRLGGGIGTRGPGEKKLEVDRRHIYRRISYLEDELKEIKKQRELRRNQREKNEIPVVGLVGYTNAGKSTLMNAMSDAGVLAEDKLFATLDPTVRKFSLDDGQDILLIDTVGFIRKLPHQLIQAFRSTLEETINADILLHVIDCSNDEWELQKEVVLKILNDLGVKEKSIISVYNKIDKLSEQNVINYPNENYVKISAKTKLGLSDLLNNIKGLLPKRVFELKGILSYSEVSILSILHDNGKIIKEEYLSDGIMVNALVDEELHNKYKKFFK